MPTQVAHAMSGLAAVGCGPGPDATGWLDCRGAFASASRRSGETPKVAFPDSPFVCDSAFVLPLLLPACGLRCAMGSTCGGAACPLWDHVCVAVQLHRSRKDDTAAALHEEDICSQAGGGKGRSKWSRRAQKPMGILLFAGRASGQAE